MELNIALVVGFVIWCGISLALVMLSEFRVRRLKVERNSYKDAYAKSERRVNEWREHTDTWQDRHGKLVQLIGEVATIGGYAPDDDESWSKLSWKRDDIQ